MALSTLRLPSGGSPMLRDYLFGFALALAACLLLCVRPAQADTIPATATFPTPATWWSLGSFAGPSKQNACSQFLTNQGLGAYQPHVATDTACLYTVNGVQINDWGTVTYYSFLKCPTGYTLSGTTCTGPATYTCPTNYTLDPSGNTCTSTVTCPASGTVHSKGFYNIGTVRTGKLLNSACVNSCTINLINGYSPAGHQVINGVLYYFGKAEYRHTGQNCSPDTPNMLSDFVGVLPAGSCAAGQQLISMNGVTKCYTTNGTEANTQSASDAAAAQSLKDAKIAAAKAAAEAAAAAAGGDASAVQAAGVQAAVDAAKADTTASGPASDFCATNPTADQCAQQDFGTVEDSTLPEETRQVQITPVSVGGAGSCPAPSPMTLHGHTYYFEWTIYCNYATAVKPLLLAFAWLAAAGILVGGFRAS